MRYSLGIDLGTTFTAAAVSGESGTRVVPLGPDVVAPSTVFARPDGTLLTGELAEIAAAVDPTRVSRGHKRRLGDPTPLVIGGAAYAPAALLAAQLRDVVDAVTAQEGAPPDSVVLTCPAVWGPYRREHFEEVHRLAGLTNVRVVTEPEAAATHYSVERRLGDGALIAVYDLGGGTFDATVLRADRAGMQILGTPEGVERLGGIDFDETLLAHLDAALSGALHALDPTSPSDAATLAAARALCVKAKEDLSTEPDVTLPVPLPGDPRKVLISRTQFDAMIRHSVALTTEALHRTIQSAGLRPDDVTGVFLAGGSSRVPLVSRMVSDAFGKPIHIGLHPKLTVALGAAAIARNSSRTAAGTTAVVPRRDLRPVVPAVPAVPAVPGDRARRRGWLLPAAAVTVAAAVTAAVALVFSGAPQDDAHAAADPSAPQVKGSTAGSSAGATTTTTTTATPVTTTTTATAASPAVAPTAAPPEPAPGRAGGAPDLEVYRGPAPTRYLGMLGSAEDGWAGQVIGDDRTASYQAISAAPDGQSGLRVRWSGTAPGQVYLQHADGGSDLSAYAGAAGALVIDLVVHQSPTATTALAVHCGYPCAAELNATSVLRGLPVGTPRSVKIPVGCFTAAGLDPSTVSTPFLLATAGRFDATVGHVRWVAGAAGDPDATPCDALR